MTGATGATYRFEQSRGISAFSNHETNSTNKTNKTFEYTTIAREHDEDPRRICLEKMKKLVMPARMPRWP